MRSLSTPLACTPHPYSSPRSATAPHAPARTGAALRLATIAAALVLGGTARAGEVQVKVANFQFTPPSVTVNLGDHIVWVWTGGNHSVTSGAGGTPDGKFDSAVIAASANSAFSWKSNVAGLVPYY